MLEHTNRVRLVQLPPHLLKTTLLLDGLRMELLSHPIPPILSQSLPIVILSRLSLHRLMLRSRPIQRKAVRLQVPASMIMVPLSLLRLQPMKAMCFSGGSRMVIRFQVFQVILLQRLPMLIMWQNSNRFRMALS